jgi:hypothetical protein
MQQQRIQFRTSKLTQTEGVTVAVSGKPGSLSQKHPKIRKFICVKHVFQGHVMYYFYEFLLFTSHSGEDLAANGVLNYPNIEKLTSLKYNKDCFCKLPKCLTVSLVEILFSKAKNMLKILHFMFLFHLSNFFTNGLTLSFQVIVLK